MKSIWFTLVPSSADVPAAGCLTQQTGCNGKFDRTSKALMACMTWRY